MRQNLKFKKSKSEIVKKKFIKKCHIYCFNPLLSFYGLKRKSILDKNTDNIEF